MASQCLPAINTIYLKYMLNKLSDPAGLEVVGLIRAVVVQVEPVRQLYLKADPHNVVPVFRRQVDYKATEMNKKINEYITIIE